MDASCPRVDYGVEFFSVYVACAFVFAALEKTTTKLSKMDLGFIFFRLSMSSFDPKFLYQPARPNDWN